MVAEVSNNGSGDQYGWARVKFGGGSVYDENFWLADYAYADPGEPIRAGQRSSNEIVSEKTNEMATSEGSLGLLALGAAGLIGWRKSRQNKN